MYDGISVRMRVVMVIINLVIILLVAQADDPNPPSLISLRNSSPSNDFDTVLGKIFKHPRLYISAAKYSIKCIPKSKRLGRVRSKFLLRQKLS